MRTSMRSIVASELFQRHAFSPLHRNNIPLPSLISICVYLWHERKLPVRVETTREREEGDKILALKHGKRHHLLI